FHMVRIRGRSESKYSGEHNWLIFKHVDEYADTDWTMKTILNYGSRSQAPGRVKKSPARKDALKQLLKSSRAKTGHTKTAEKEMAMGYPELQDLTKWVSAKEAIIDGEIIVVNTEGTASFQQLQARFGVTNASAIERLVKTQKIVYYVFDLLYLDGYSLLDAK